MRGKKLIGMIIGIAVIALLAGAYIIIKNLPEEVPADTIGENTSDENSTGDKTPEKDKGKVENDAVLTSLNVRSHDNEIDIHLGEDGSYVMTGYELNNYNSDFDSFIKNFKKFEPKETISEHNDFTEYGIDGENSQAVIGVEFEDGKKVRYFIGDMLVDGGSYYYAVEGDDDLYIAGSTAKKAFISPIELISETLANPMGTSSYILTEKFVLSRAGKEPVTVEFVKDEDERSNGPITHIYEMTSPLSGYVSDIGFDGVLSLLINPTADKVIAAGDDITEELLAKYGFSDPMPYILGYVFGGEERIICFGNKTDDGKIYVWSPDYGIVGTADIEEKFPFLDWTPEEFISETLLTMHIDNVTKITVSGQDINDTYELVNNEDVLTVTNTATGEVVDTKNFREFYMTFLRTTRLGVTENTNKDTWLLTVRVETRSGKIFEYKFYEISTTKCLYTVNGEGSYYLSRDRVNKLQSDAEKLSRGEKIDSDDPF